ncbi:MAG: cytochrome c [Alphaproteobacteria bacterium]|nr:cytochrome c [Alphaproteobacteria bacterium]
MVPVLVVGVAWATPDAEVGALLAGLAGCASCHTAADGAPYAGGYAIETRFGTFYGSNLTPDPETGLGEWTEHDLLRALTRGRSPKHHPYWPAFPYTSFRRLTDEDVGHLWAFLRTLDPVVAEEREQEANAPGVGLWGWRRVAFHARDWKPLDDPELDRGAYLVEVVGHCGECHTPRNGIGQLKRKQALAGSDEPPHPAPDIRPETLKWTLGDWDTFLTMGMMPDGDFAGSGMRHVVRDGTAKLPEADRAAMIRWLMAPTE